MRDLLEKLRFNKEIRRSYILILGIVLFLLAGEQRAIEAQDLYLGKRWGFSQMTATPVDRIAWSPDGRYLFFIIAGDELTYIYRIKDVWKILKGRTLPGDIRPDRIMEVKGRITDFSFAHGRMAAAYSIPEGISSGLYIANLATCETKRITQGRAPRWDPLDRKILFYYTASSGIYGLGEINIDGSGRHVITEVNDWGPEWSPDGKMIAFLSSRGFAAGTRDLSNVFVYYLSPPRTKKVTQDMNAFQKYVSWCPRGKKIVFETYNGVEVIDISTFQRKLVIPRGDFYTSHEFEPFFSPDGRWIIYRREKGMGLYQVYTQEEVTVEGSVVWEHLALSPDGKKICFSVNEKGPRKGMWIVEAFEY